MLWEYTSSCVKHFVCVKLKYTLILSDDSALLKRIKKIDEYATWNVTGIDPLEVMSVDSHGNWAEVAINMIYNIRFDRPKLPYWSISNSIPHKLQSWT